MDCEGKGGVSGAVDALMVAVLSAGFGGRARSNTL